MSRDRHNQAFSPARSSQLLQQVPELRAGVRPDRRVLLPPDDWDTWLTGDADQEASLIVPLLDHVMRAHPVATRVDNLGYQGADLLEAAGSGGS